MAPEISILRDRTMPQWAIALTSASAMGIYLIDDPVLFVLAVIYETIVDGMLTIAGHFANIIMSVFGEFGAALLGIAMIPIGVGGAIGGLVLELVALLVSIMTGLASIAGPFSPIIIVGMWVIAGYLAIALLTALKKAIPLVIPWL